jgi:hypothetical protein
MLEWSGVSDAHDRSRVIGSWEWDSRTEERQDLVLDVVFIAVSLLFFALSVGYVRLCDRLMK